MQQNRFFVLAALLAGVSCGTDQLPGPDKTSPDGKALFRRHCVTCHGADGTLGLNGAGDLTKSARTQAERVVQITKGKNLMPAFEEVLTPEEIQAVANYTETLKK
ncbi:MAG: cytochrome c [Lewinellaceae bacterium]|nr:cytochrome c [Lewinellaceae bacterium]